MKKMMKKILAVAMASAMLLSCAVTVGAVEAKVGTVGDYTIIVHNDDDTGITIDGDTFHAYQIFTASDVTSYEVTENFKDFFVGEMTAGDGTGTKYDFATQLAIMNDGTASEFDKAEAAKTYNHLAGLYMNSYKNDMYTLAQEIRAYLDENGAYNKDGGIECVSHGTAGENADGSESATLSGLGLGYYFVMDQDVDVVGLGVAHSGAFVPIGSTDAKTKTIKVKESVPTVTKQIYHNDKDMWDVVGDHQIGDVVDFLVTSTLPSNIEEYTTYKYELTDKMSKGITYNGDVRIYTDISCADEYEVDADEFLTINNDPGNGLAFVVNVDAKTFIADPAHTEDTVLYTRYSGTVNSSAVVAKDHDTNTITLEFSNNPNKLDQTGTSSSTVFHYTFAMNIEKVDENKDGLAGARFGIFLGDGTAIKLQKGNTDLETGIVSYFPTKDTNVADVADGGYITTEAVTLNDGTVVTGKFRIYGLDDAVTYILREVEAPADYNKVDDVSFEITASYNSMGSGVTSVTSGSNLIHSDGSELNAKIMNLKTVFLPATGGMGTTLFQIGGGALMLGGALFLVMNRRKKEN